MASAARLPGIEFETVARSAGDDALPRMDVAVFVGFAAAGPVHRPVLVESVAAFQRVFGADLALARDPAGEVLRAGLGPSVRAFFSNGGVRCWVVRVARTRALEARWRGVAEGALTEAKLADVASARRFPIPGVLALGAGGQLAPATARARSLGAWADGLTVAARAERSPLRVAAVTPATKSGAFRITADHRFRSGELLEFGAADEVLAYAQVDAAAVGEAPARWIGAFTALADVSAAVVVEDESSSWPARLDGPAGTLAFEDAAAPRRASGAWIRLGLPYDEAWFLVDAVVDGALQGRAWAWRPGIPHAVPSPISCVTLGLTVDAARAEGVGLTPAHPASWWNIQPDDISSTPGGFPIAADQDGAVAWLPVGLGGRYSSRLPPFPENRTALERDGLSRFDGELFLDPELAATRVPQLVSEAERIRDLDGRPLFGIHAALGIGGVATGFTEPSLIAVPDAALPGWARRGVEALPPPSLEADAPAHWFGHRGPCTVADHDAPGTGPDRSRFLDCATRLLATPRFLPLPEQQRVGPLLLRWTASDAGARYVLESASRADFGDAEEIWSGTETEHLVLLAREGLAYYRLRACIADETSLPDAIGVVIRDTAWEALGDGDASVLTTVHRALLRLAAASGDYFALLSLPRGFHAAAAIDHARRIARRREGFGDPDRLDHNERRALSYGALYHPWIVAASVDRPEEAMIVAPPDGAVAGLFARRAADRGAWIAPANDALRDIVALAPSIPDGRWLDLDVARVNLIRKNADDFRVLDADTLSDESEWRQVNVRRLMSLIRRVAIRRGAAYMFEPNGPVLRRAIERGFGQMLGHMFGRGAFAGRTPAEAFRLAIDSGAGDGARVVIEIAVAPSQPLRFLTLRLAQAGERLTIAEER